MSVLIQAQTSDDDDEINACLDLVLDSAPLGLMHESVNVNRVASYTSESASFFGGGASVQLLTITSCHGIRKLVRL